MMAMTDSRPPLRQRASRSCRSPGMVSGDASPYDMLRACASSAAMAASSDSVGVSNVRNTVLAHCSHDTDAGTSCVKNFSFPHVRQISVVTPRTRLLAIVTRC